MTLAEDFAAEIEVECFDALDAKLAVLGAAAVAAHRADTLRAKQRFVAAAEAMRLEADTVEAVFGEDALDCWADWVEDRDYNLFVLATAAVRPGIEKLAAGRLLAEAVRLRAEGGG